MLLPDPPSGSLSVTPGPSATSRWQTLESKREDPRGNPHHLGEKPPLKTGSDTAGRQRHTPPQNLTSKNRLVLLQTHNSGPCACGRSIGRGASQRRAQGLPPALLSQEASDCGGTHRTQPGCPSRPPCPQAWMWMGSSHPATARVLPPPPTVSWIRRCLPRPGFPPRLILCSAHCPRGSSQDRTVYSISPPAGEGGWSQAPATVLPGLWAPTFCLPSQPP